MLELPNSLAKADHDLDEFTRNAFVLRYFITCLPEKFKIVLFEKNPTPNFEEVVCFVLQSHVIQSLAYSVSKA